MGAQESSHEDNHSTKNVSTEQTKNQKIKAPPSSWTDNKINSSKMLSNTPWLSCGLAEMTIVSVHRQ